MRLLRAYIAMLLLVCCLALVGGVLPSPVSAQSTLVDASVDLKRQVADLAAKGRHGEAVSLQRKLVDLVEAEELASTTSGGPKTVSALGNLSWFALMAGLPDEALIAADRALSLAPEAAWIDANRAHALLFLGRLDEAKSAYMRQRGGAFLKTLDETWDEVIAQDFDQLAKAGFRHSEMDAIVVSLGGCSAENRVRLGASRQEAVRLFDEGRLVESLVQQESHIKLVAQILGNQHARYAKALIERSEILLKLRRISEAESNLVEASKVRELAFGDDHLVTADGYLRLAEILKQQNRPREAENLFKQVLAIREKRLGPEDLSVATSLVDLALVQRTQNRKPEAEAALKRAIAIREKAFGPLHSEIALILGVLASIYDSEGRFAEAEPLHKRAVASFEEMIDVEKPSLGVALLGLGKSYLRQNRDAEAEPLLLRALNIRESTAGPDNREISFHLAELVVLYLRQERYAEAEVQARRSLAILEKSFGPEDRRVADGLILLGNVHTRQGRLAQAEPLLERALAIFEKVPKPDDLVNSAVLTNLASLYLLQGRYSKAEPLFKRELDVTERALGPDAPSVAISLSNLAWSRLAAGRHAEAEPLYKRALAISEKALGPEHADVATILHSLAELYRAEGRKSEAEAFYKRAIAVFGTSKGSDAREVALSMGGLAHLYATLNRYSDADELYKRAIEISKKRLGRDHPQVASLLMGLAGLLKNWGQYAIAEPVYEEVLHIRERAFGPDHPDVTAVIYNVASLREAQGRFVEAEGLYLRDLAVSERIYGPDHPHIGNLHNQLAWNAIARNDLPRAASEWRRATAVVQRRVERGLGDSSNGENGEAGRFKYYFDGLVKVSHRLPSASNSERSQVVREMFEAAQWGAGSAAAASLVQMATRSTSGATNLADLVRERQDLAAEWLVKDKALLASKSAPLAQRSEPNEKSLSERLDSIDKRRAEIDARLSDEFPDYSALSNIKPSSIAEVQADLADDEALIMFLDTSTAWAPALPAETFVWAVTKSDVLWVRSELGSEAIAREVAALRCGLDQAGAWRSDSPKCRELTGIDYTEFDDRIERRVPFDVARAYSLHKALLGEVQERIKGKQLLVVPSGPLTKLPLQVLVTAPPEGAKPSEIAWLARSHAITVLPSVSSLKALRRNPKERLSGKPYLGVGNPLLDGADESYAKLRGAALANTDCTTSGQNHLSSSRGVTGLRPPVQPDGMADVALLRQAPPLPETAGELCNVAKAMGAVDEDVWLGSRANEGDIKRFSEAGKLRDYRILHFATHGALAGEVSGTSEPGLLLTPPTTGSVVDDGYLSASEIAALKLDADLVVLSACNTAAGGADGAEALSGLARAFFYAGARSLLVSHWYVDSSATVDLVTKAIAELQSHPGMGRSEALRRSMLALADAGEPPSSWAPFVVVGEGGGSPEFTGALGASKNPDAQPPNNRAAVPATPAGSAAAASVSSQTDKASRASGNPRTGRPHSPGEKSKRKAAPVDAWTAKALEPR